MPRRMARTSLMTSIFCLSRRRRAHVNRFFLGGSSGSAAARAPPPQRGSGGHAPLFFEHVQRSAARAGEAERDSNNLCKSDIDLFSLGIRSNQVYVCEGRQAASPLLRHRH